MSEKIGRWQWIERVKVTLEIFAIIIAGAWAITLYWNYESPSNVTRVDLEGSLSWSKYSKDLCEAEYDVEFKNIGRVPVDIGRVRLSAYPLSKLEGLPQSESLKLIDPEKAISGPPFMQEETNRLSGSYPPDERDAEGFSFLVRRSPGSLILFRVDVWKKEESADSNAKPFRQDFRWDWVCGENPESSAGGQ